MQQWFTTLFSPHYVNGEILSQVSKFFHGHFFLSIAPCGEILVHVMKKTPLTCSEGSSRVPECTVEGIMQMLNAVQR